MALAGVVGARMELMGRREDGGIGMIDDQAGID